MSQQGGFSQTQIDELNTEKANLNKQIEEKNRKLNNLQVPDNATQDEKTQIENQKKTLETDIKLLEYNTQIINTLETRLNDGENVRLNKDPAGYKIEEIRPEMEQQESGDVKIAGDDPDAKSSDDNKNQTTNPEVISLVNYYMDNFNKNFESIARGYKDALIDVSADFSTIRRLFDIQTDADLNKNFAKNYIKSAIENGMLNPLEFMNEFFNQDIIDNAKIYKLTASMLFADSIGSLPITVGRKHLQNILHAFRDALEYYYRLPTLNEHFRYLSPKKQLERAFQKYRADLQLYTQNLRDEHPDIKISAPNIMLVIDDFVKKGKIDNASRN